MTTTPTMSSETAHDGTALPQPEALTSANESSEVIEANNVESEKSSNGLGVEPSQGLLLTEQVRSTGSPAKFTAATTSDPATVTPDLTPPAAIPTSVLPSFATADPSSPSTADDGTFKSTSAQQLTSKNGEDTRTVASTESTLPPLTSSAPFYISEIRIAVINTPPSDQNNSSAQIASPRIQTVTHSTATTEGPSLSTTDTTTTFGEPSSISTSKRAATDSSSPPVTEKASASFLGSIAAASAEVPNEELTADDHSLGLSTTTTQAEELNIGIKSKVVEDFSLDVKAKSLMIPASAAPPAVTKIMKSVAVEDPSSGLQETSTITQTSNEPLSSTYDVPNTDRTATVAELKTQATSTTSASGEPLLSTVKVSKLDGTARAAELDLQATLTTPTSGEPFSATYEVPKIDEIAKAAEDPQTTTRTPASGEASSVADSDRLAKAAEDLSLAPQGTSTRTTASEINSTLVDASRSSVKAVEFPSSVAPASPIPSTDKISIPAAGEVASFDPIITATTAELLSSSELLSTPSKNRSISGSGPTVVPSSTEASSSNLTSTDWPATTGQLSSNLATESSYDPTATADLPLTSLISKSVSDSESTAAPSSTEASSSNLTSTVWPTTTGQISSNFATKSSNDPATTAQLPPSSDSPATPLKASLSSNSEPPTDASPSFPALTTWPTTTATEPSSDQNATSSESLSTKEDNKSRIESSTQSNVEIEYVASSLKVIGAEIDSQTESTRNTSEANRSADEVKQGQVEVKLADNDQTTAISDQLSESSQVANQQTSTESSPQASEKAVMAKTQTEPASSEDSDVKTQQATAQSRSQRELASKSTKDQNVSKADLETGGISNSSSSTDPGYSTTDANAVPSSSTYDNSISSTNDVIGSFTTDSTALFTNDVTGSYTNDSSSSAEVNSTADSALLDVTKATESSEASLDGLERKLPIQLKNKRLTEAETFTNLSNQSGTVAELNSSTVKFSDIIFPDRSELSEYILTTEVRTESTPGTGPSLSFNLDSAVTIQNWIKQQTQEFDGPVTLPSAANTNPLFNNTSSSEQGIKDANAENVTLNPNVQVHSDRFTTEKPFSQDEANSGSKMVEELMIRTTDHEANFELNPANLFIGDLQIPVRKEWQFRGSWFQISVKVNLLRNL